MSELEKTIHEYIKVGHHQTLGAIIGRLPHNTGFQIVSAIVNLKALGLVEGNAQDGYKPVEKEVQA